MRPAAPRSRLNAMTIDVEDYFHVSVFDKTVRPSDWGGMESRVVANTERLLDLFDEHLVKPASVEILTALLRRPRH